MSSASFQTSSDSHPVPLRRRVGGFVLALIAELLLLLLLLTLAPSSTSHKVEKEKRPLTFGLLPGTKPATQRAARARSASKAKSDSARPTTQPLPPPPVPVPNKKPSWIVDKDDFDASNIASIPSNKSGGTGSDDGKDSGAAYGPGEGPGGERLFNAEWYVEPTDAQLSTYMPAGQHQSGWAEVACKTIPNYGVENCRSLGESPLGSGLARTLRLAAWQFKVRPPRLGGKTLVGAWVRIHFDFTVTERKSNEPASSQ